MNDARVVDRLQLGDHVCWIFDDDQSCLSAMARFVDSGLRAGHHVSYLTASLPPGAVLAGLQGNGVDVHPALETGQLVVAPAEEEYLADGQFDPGPLLDRFATNVAAVAGAGYPGMRVITDMSWALRPRPGAHRLSWYEAEANRLFLDERLIGVCLYDRRLFDANLLRRVARAHPCISPADPDSGWRPPLRLRRSTDPNGLQLDGAADCSSRHALSAALNTLAHDPRYADTPAYVDLTALTFLDAGAASLLTRAAAAVPAGLTLTGCSPPVTRTLTLIGADQAPGLTLVPAHDTAGPGPAEAAR